MSPNEIGGIITLGIIMRYGAPLMSLFQIILNGANASSVNGSDAPGRSGIRVMGFAFTEIPARNETEIPSYRLLLQYHQEAR